MYAAIRHSYFETEHILDTEEHQGGYSTINRLSECLQPGINPRTYAVRDVNMRIHSHLVEKVPWSSLKRSPKCAAALVAALPRPRDSQSPTHHQVHYDTKTRR
mmetsp:Transcript_23435/g.49740  ORF Transcript_23435/g.49740 Transcript_23435/m.49740 type:complete len:103 (-) Transcript_23435:2147-2455(-)